MLYFRAASTEDGHGKAGHGNFGLMKERAGVDTDWSALKLKRSLEQNDRRNADMGARLPHDISASGEAVLQN